MQMTFMDYVFQGLTIVASLLVVVGVLRQADSVRVRREYKKRIARAEEFSRAIQAQLHPVEGGAEVAAGTAAD